MANLIDRKKLRQEFYRQKHTASLMLLPVIYYQLDQSFPSGKMEVAPDLFAEIDNNWETALGAKKNCSIAVLKLEDAERWLNR